MEIKFAKKL